MTLAAEVRVRLGNLDLDASLTAAPGRVVALLGPNGAGKTTLLRCLAGLQPLDSGSIRLDGALLDDPAGGAFTVPERRPVGFVFQEYLLFPHLSVLENVAFGLRSRGRQGALDAARRWLERVELGDLAAARPASLSGGQAQRVAVARALATEPRLLLLDEPLAALDATSKVSLRRELKRHLTEFGGIAIVVSHDPVDAAVLADDVTVLEGGEVRQQGTMGEIAARPRSRYVADLVGVNLWRGRAGAGTVTVAGTDVSVAADVAGDAFLLVHPRAVSLFSAEPHGSPRNVWRGRAASIESAAGGVRVSVDGPLPIVAEITPGALAELGLAGGEEVWVSFKASEVEVYEA